MLRGPTVNRCAALAYSKRIDGCEHKIDEWIQSKADARAPQVRTIESLAIREHPSTSDWFPIPHGRVGSKAEMATGIRCGLHHLRMRTLPLMR